MPYHKDLIGGSAVHQATYYQSADPGAVGALKLWVDTTTGPPWALKIRNPGNTAWEAIAGGSSGSSSVMYAHSADISIAVADALSVGYTSELMLTSSTTPTAATVFGQLQTFSSNVSYLDSDVLSSGFPEDLAVAYNGSVMDTDVLECTSTRIRLRFPIQAPLGGSSTNTTQYKLTWGSSTPSTPHTLSSVYIFGSDFDSIPAGSDTNSTPSIIAPRLVKFTPGGGFFDPSGYAITFPSTPPLDMGAEMIVLSATNESAWTSDHTRFGLCFRAHASDAYRGINVILTSSAHSYLVFLDDGVAWQDTAAGFGPVSLGTFYHLKGKVVGGTVYSKAWPMGSHEPSTWQDSWNFPTSRVFPGFKITTPNWNGDSVDAQVRHLRVFQAVANDPVITLI